ncbi:hypothetical protein F2P46_21775 [Massilia sp. CCM 8734]|nr:hypothetical protein [Massilia sp. CCM 8734]
MTCPASRATCCQPCAPATPNAPVALSNPRIGEQRDEFEPREVRRILVGHDEEMTSTPRKPAAE